VFPVIADSSTNFGRNLESGSTFPEQQSRFDGQTTINSYQLRNSDLRSSCCSKLSVISSQRPTGSSGLIIDLGECTVQTNG